MDGKIIIGILALVGIGLGAYYLATKSNTGVEKDDNNAPQKSDVVSKPNNSVKDVVEEAAEEFKENKAGAAETIKTRHEAAAAEMKKSLENILDDSPVEQTENTDTLNEMMDDIDKLMD
jgi:hypothetical protein